MPSLLFFMKGVIYDKRGYFAYEGEIDVLHTRYVIKSDMDAFKLDAIGRRMKYMPNKNYHIE